MSHIDVDGDGRRERVCVRVAAYETKDGSPALRREWTSTNAASGSCARSSPSGPLRAERVIHLRDLDMDGSAELVT